MSWRQGFLSFVALGDDARRPGVIDTLIEGAFAALAPEATIAALDRARAELANLEREIARLVSAVGTVGDMPDAVAAIKARQARQDRRCKALGPRDRAKSWVIAR